MNSANQKELMIAWKQVWNTLQLDLVEAPTVNWASQFVCYLFDDVFVERDLFTAENHMDFIRSLVDQWMIDKFGKNARCVLYQNVCMKHFDLDFVLMRWPHVMFNFAENQPANYRRFEQFFHDYRKELMLHLKNEIEKL